MKARSKMIQQPAIGLLVTWSKDMIRANGGLLSFIRHFEECCRDEDSGYWLHKCKNRPAREFDHVYVIVCNQVRYRLFFGGYEVGEANVFRANGEERTITWPRIVLAGPFEKAPFKIPMKGFQGFRYVNEHFW